MKQLTVCIDDGLQWEVVYRAEISHTEEDYQELKSDLEFVREENKKLNIKVASLEWEIKWLNSVIDKLKEENQYRESVADVLPEWEGHIAEETISDLQARINELSEENGQLRENEKYRHSRCMKAERGN